MSPGSQADMCMCMHAKSLQSHLTLGAHQAPLSMGFISQEYWCGPPCPPPGDLPDPGIKPVSPAAPALQVDSLPLSQKDFQIFISSHNQFLEHETSMCCYALRSVCLTLCNPMDCSLPGTFCPWNSPGKNTGMGCHFLFQGLDLHITVYSTCPHNAF